MGSLFGAYGYADRGSLARFGPRDPPMRLVHDGSPRPPAGADVSARVLLGVVGAPHGVRGEVRVKSFTADPGAIARYGALVSEDGRRTLTIAKARPLKDDMLVARFVGVDTREAAAALTGLRLTVERTALPAAEEDEFYHADLIGLLAVAEDGRPLGRVAAVQNFGGGDLLEIAGEGEARMVPFTKAFVPHVDLDARRLTVAEAALAEDAPDAPGEGDG